MKLPYLGQGPSNKAQGTFFEKVFERQALLQSMMVKHNGLQTKYVAAGKKIQVKSNLDFLLIPQNGPVGIFDCKSFCKDYFTYSQINERQISLAASYNERNVPSGFVVLFEKLNKICFYTGQQIIDLGERSRFGVENSLVLGKLEYFDLKLLFPTTLV
jgi:penicillin-binding protein-related factor A (putative recombinase)